MKVISILLVFVLLLSGCSLLGQNEPPQNENNLSYAGTGDIEVYVSDEEYIFQNGMLSNGGIGELPDDEEDGDDTDDAEIPVEDLLEIDSVLVGEWEYVDTMTYVYVLTINRYGGAELEQYYQRADGTRSLSYRMSCHPTIEDGCITFPPDVEYGPPSLVLQYEYVDGVGDILTVVTSNDSLSDLTEYFYHAGYYGD